MNKFYVTRKVTVEEELYPGRKSKKEKVTKRYLSPRATDVLNMRIQDFIKKNWTEGRIPKELKEGGEIYATRYKTVRYGDPVWTGRKFEPEHRRYEATEIKLKTMYDLITLENVYEFMRIKNSANKPTKTGIGENSRKKLDKILEPYRLKFGMKIEKEEG